MSPGKHPPEGAQNETLTPAIGRAAAAHGAHALDETSDDGEEQIQPQHPPNHPPDHVTSSLSGAPRLMSMDPTGMHWVSQVSRRCHRANLNQPAPALATAIDLYTQLGDIGTRQWLRVHLE
jgi:hypothetical protein